MQAESAGKLEQKRSFHLPEKGENGNLLRIAGRRKRNFHSQE
jgi:hypothetical protein